MTYETIRKIVIAGGVTAKENVLIHFWGDDKDKEIANRFMVAVASVGATPTLLQQSREINRELFSAAKEDSFGTDYFERLSSFDAVLDLFTYQPIILGYELEPAQFALYRKYMATLFSALMKSKRFIQIRIPTEANAKESSLDPNDYIQKMTAAYDVDYDALKQRCKERINAYKNLKTISIKTGECCQITFSLNGRSWHVDAGDGDMPCGEIYIAPVEDQTNGQIFFEKLYLDGDVCYEVTVTVENGKLISADHKAVSAWLEKLEENERIVCELGFGMNPNVKDTCGYTALDEKMAGSFHIALGANTMFGGKNAAKMHEDLVCTGNFEIIEQ